MLDERIRCLWLGSDGLVSCADRMHLSGYFTKTELEEIKDAIIKTLGYYELENITDEFVKEQDDAQRNQELKEWEENRSISKKERVDDLYLILDEDANHLKIGRSKNVKERLNQLQIANSHKLKLLNSIPKKGYIEKELHDTFKDKKVKGEWFVNDGEIIDYFNAFLV